MMIRSVTAHFLLKLKIKENHYNINGLKTILSFFHLFVCLYESLYIYMPQLWRWV